MRTRRQVETFANDNWQKKPGQDGITHAVSVKLNGVDEPFRVTQPYSDTIRVSIAHHLGHDASGDELKAIANLKIQELASIGYFDEMNPSQPITLPDLHYLEVDSLVAEGRRRRLFS